MGQHHTVGAGEAPEESHPLRETAQRDEGGPRLLSEQDDGLEVMLLVPFEDAVHVADPDRGIADALALEVLDENIVGDARTEDLLLEFGRKTRHAPRVGVIGGDNQNTPALGVIRAAPPGHRQQQSRQKKQKQEAEESGHGGGHGSVGVIYGVGIRSAP